MLGTLLGILVFGLVALVVAGAVIAVIGALLGVVSGLAGLLLFKVVPLLLIGWLFVKLIGRSRNGRRISAADQRWLDS